ncbi:sensor histidine kinase [Natronogracilivirga saccharolytica]|uniref:histidine kinase n=1 Tax=Natronogracilivirga saccharolytica TaxID=2812953 RepID=A0A8J7RIV9_9BACT|nr:ATP-binding protein [Natronogracilivirga saccharolytica]MBP3191445.1 cyclic nucleotide-binding domain-containing protein [Natronogracilivirga saccharolytica]
MILNFAKNWLQDPTRITDQIARFLENSEEFHTEVVERDKDDLFFSEGDFNESVYILLEGTVQLSKTTPKGRVITIDWLRPGALVGLISFVTGEAVLTTAVAASPCKAIKLDESDFLDMQRGKGEIAHLAQQLIIGNLIDRYHHVVSVHVELESINETLEKERNHLREALKQLEDTQHRLISQEKMATLGQLVAGIAHEINNPAAAMLRASDNLMDYLPGIVRKADPDEQLSYEKFFKIGLKRKLRDSDEQRRKLKEWEDLYPDLPRSLLRKVTSMSDEALEIIRHKLGERPGKKQREELENIMLFFESGYFLKNLQSSTKRIGEIVSSMKNYSRQDKGSYEKADLRDGLNDTLLLLSNRLKKVDVVLNFSDIPPVNVITGEINQVWTNIIINACDAMGDKGELVISCGYDDRYVWVSIKDSGPGISPSMINEVFKTNFTTKQQNSSFGLGLGLSISKQIIQKHGGQIKVQNAEDGGAEFTVFIPL